MTADGEPYAGGIKYDFCLHNCLLISTDLPFRGSRPLQIRLKMPTFVRKLQVAGEVGLQFNSN